jgi:DnaK suppressor protein
VSVRRTQRFTPAELNEFRGALIEKRREILRDVAGLQREARWEGGSAQRRGLSGLVHPAESASDTWEQEFSIGLLERERLLLVEVNDALLRMRQNRYGICEATGRPITKARLRAIPWARYCIEYARKGVNDADR